MKYIAEIILVEGNDNVGQSIMSIMQTAKQYWCRTEVVGARATGPDLEDVAENGSNSLRLTFDRFRDLNRFYKEYLQKQPHFKECFYWPKDRGYERKRLES